MMPLRSSVLAICLATTVSASDDSPDLDDWSDIITTVRCAAVGKVSEQPDYKAFENMSLEALRSFFVSVDDGLLIDVQYSLLHLEQIALDDSVDFKAGVAFSVLYRETLGAIERRIGSTSSVIPDFPSSEEQGIARELYAKIDCEGLLR